MIKVKNLKKSYGQKEVLKGVNLEVPSQSIFGFIGINGAGKSTLIKCLLKFLELDEGQIYMEDISLKAHVNLKQLTGYLPEVFLPPLNLKCGEFLNYCFVLITNRNLSQNNIHLMLKKVGLSDSENIIIKKLSKGMRQRLGIAQAMIHNPELLILDEPFSGLDPIGRFELKQLFKSLNQEGMTIFFSSHNLTEIQDLCSHVAILHQGKITIQDTIQNILTKYQTANFEQAFLKAINHSFKGATS